MAEKRWRLDQSGIVDPDVPATSRMRTNMAETTILNDDTSSVDPGNWPRFKIFLSHSGAQNDFVEILCEELESRHRFPFFDKRPDSLPRGDRFPEAVLQAAQQCEMAVVVVSEQYFTSKWSMFELHAFVQTQRLNRDLRIFPLFYGLLVSDIRKRLEAWCRVWEEWARNDPRIRFHELKEAFEVLMRHNGLEYDRTTGVAGYLEDAVSRICADVRSDIKWDASHVQGRDAFCQAIYDKIQHIRREKNDGVCFVGIYGVGGIGKTTMCKTLCNDFIEELEGNVSHIEMGSASTLDLMQGVLRDLTGTRTQFLRHFDKDQCRHILREGLSKRKAFVAIDNVLDDSESIDTASIFLRSRFHDGSIVVVTSPTLKTLADLGLDEFSCMEMPRIGDEDARRLFLYYAARGVVLPSTFDEHVIGQCVALGDFGKGDEKGHYLPLALKVLGVLLAHLDPSQWVKALPEVNYLQEGLNPVYGILRTSFDRLQRHEQDLFMDVVKFAPMSKFAEELKLMDWLSQIHRVGLLEILLRLQRLKDKGLLEDVDVPSQKIMVHDLYVDFAKLECEGKLEQVGDPRWRYYEDKFPTEMEISPFWKCMSRLGIVSNSRLSWHNGSRLDGIEWEKLSTLEALKLVRLEKLQGVLDLCRLRCLISIELVDITALDRLKGLQDLESLTYFRWIRDDNSFMDARTSNSSTQLCTKVGQFPMSLRVLELCVGVQLRPDAFARCTDLLKLTLAHCRTESLDFSSCSSLVSVKLHSLESLRTLLGLTSASVASIDVSHCPDLVEIPGLDHSVGLRRLRLYSNRKLKKLPALLRLSELEVLYVHSLEIGSLGCLLQLRELTCTSLPRSAKPPSLSGFQELEAVSFCGSKGLSSLEGVFVGGLPKLRSLELSECSSLVHLPDLSSLTNLEELGLCDTGIELREEDIRMLKALPRLNPVRVGPMRVGDVSWHNCFRLDVEKWKVLEWVKAAEDEVRPTESWLSWTKWEERDLGELPIDCESICEL